VASPNNYILSGLTIDSSHRFFTLFPFLEKTLITWIADMSQTISATYASILTSSDERSYQMKDFEIHGEKPIAPLALVIACLSTK
jgi:hypothetical protein